MSYSQNDEEEVILRYVGSVSDGRFLDIGAYDGKTFSNTLKLVELGWSGVCVEPSPSAFAGLLNLHGMNSKIVLLNSAVTPDGGWLEFYDSGGDALSTFDLEHIRKWSASGVKFTRYTLMAVSLHDLLTKFGTEYDFINIDVEQGNWELLNVLPWGLLKRLKLLCIEYDYRAFEMYKIAACFGFKPIHANGENIILYRA